MENTNYFKKMNEININDKVEKKNGYSYLSWAFAWGELKKLHPDATTKVYENKDGLPFFKSEEGYIVKVGVTVNNIEHISYLPVMDLRNKAMKVADMMDINKAIQRATVKAIGLHGLGLYLYAGEDLPESDSGASQAQLAPTTQASLSWKTGKYLYFSKDEQCKNHGFILSKKGQLYLTSNEEINFPFEFQRIDNKK